MCRVRIAEVTGLSSYGPLHYPEYMSKVNEHYLNGSPPPPETE